MNPDKLKLLQEFKIADDVRQDLLNRFTLAEYLEESYGMPGDVARVIAGEAVECKKNN